MYKRVAPIDKPNTISIVPIHLPNTNPPTKKTGEPNPKSITQIITPIKNNMLAIKRLEFLTSFSLSLLFFISSKLEKSSNEK